MLDSLFDYIDFPNGPRGVVDFRATVADWEIQYETARCFHMRGFAELAEECGLGRRYTRFNREIIAGAVERGSIPQAWVREIPSTMWRKFGDEQLTRALTRKPMSLIKAAQAIFCLEKQLEELAAEGQEIAHRPDDVVRLVPCMYRPAVNDDGTGFDERYLKNVSSAQMDAFRDSWNKDFGFDVEKAGPFLTDLTKRRSASYELAALVVGKLSPQGRDLVIVENRRNHQANCPPSSDNWEFIVAL